MSLQIIGTGLPRTGTYALKHALEHLGFGPCYHLFDLVWKRPEDIDHFISHGTERKREIQWTGLFRDFRSAVDFPTARYYRELYNIFPGAKFIHTTRDPEEWHASLTETIFSEDISVFRKQKRLVKSLLFSPTRKRLKAIRLNKKLLSEYLGGDIQDKKLTTERFREHEKEVRRFIPHDQLLVYQVKEGWSPLADFLSKPVPLTPFPHINSRREFLERVKK